MLRKVSLIFALIGATLNLFIAGLYTGFEEGYKSGSMFSGETSYVQLSMEYLMLALCFLGFVVGKLIKKPVLSLLVGFSAEIIIFFVYRKIYLIKSYYFGDVESFSELIRRTIPHDWFCFSLVVILFIYQIALALQYYFGKNRGRRI